VTDTAPPARPRTRADLASFLVERVSCYLGLPAEQIAPDVPVADYGLDSVSALALCGDLEDALGRPVEPVLLLEAETIAALSELLAEPA
jgi:acyl carrier protein